MAYTYGTRATITDGATAAVSNDTYSADSDAVDWDSEGHTHVRFIVDMDLGAVPTAPVRIRMFARPMNIDGTNDSPVPTDNYPEHYLGDVVLDVNADQHFVTSRAFLLPPNDNDTYRFYFKNTSGQTASSWDIDAQPLSKTAN